MSKLQVGVDAPFVWPGSKRRVANVVWQAFGDVDNYIEPFAGALGVLLRRPQDHKRKAETINDLDGYVANFWRSVRNRPDEVAAHADFPVSHVDLFARHSWLRQHRKHLLSGLSSDPDWCDPKIAGWWMWGLNLWIGTGWCDGGNGLSSSKFGKRPHLADFGRGIHAKRPHLGDYGQGIHAKRQHLSNYGQGIHAGVGPDGQGDLVRAWCHGLADRLRRVRLMHGDWSRCVSSGALRAGASVGVLLDPPYEQSTLAHEGAVYGEHSSSVSAEARKWAIRAVEDDKRLRVALCGYEDEHAAHMPPSWRVFAWSSTGLQSTRSCKSNQTRHKERIWFSPACLEVDHVLQRHGCGDA